MKYKKQNRNSISRNISESDLATFKEYDGSVATRNQILYKLGVDTSMNIEVIECQHRNLQGKADRREIVYVLLRGLIGIG